MHNDKKRNAYYTFSLPKEFLCIINNGGVIFLSPIVFVLLRTIISEPLFLHRRLIICCALTAVLFFLNKVLRKFTFKIIFDFVTEKIQFYMLRSNEFIEINFTDIKDIQVKRYITISFNDRKIYYNGDQEEELLSCIDRTKYFLRRNTNYH